jgi:type IV secretory pathway TraG/TraD family ATPase VirD4
MNKPGADARAFSIRDWVKDEDAGSWLFMSSRSDQHEMMRPLISTWMDIALNAIMAQERDPDRTIWIILDELPSLNKLPTLEAGLAEGRQYGAAYVVGLLALPA